MKPFQTTTIRLLVLLIAIGMVIAFIGVRVHQQKQNRNSSDTDAVTESRPRIVAGPPPQVTNGEFVSSAACRKCHPEAFESWHRSYHRSMTQIVTPETVLAPFNDLTLSSRNRTYHLNRKGDQFQIEMVDPDWDETMRSAGIDADSLTNPPIVTKDIVLSTGSHTFQTYWVRSKRGNELRQIPWVYHIPRQRWMPAEDAFIRPPDSPRRLTVWNDNCLQCHSVGGRPGQSESTGEFISQVAEYGIACESCHGPGRAHISADKNDPEAMRASITSPERCSSKRSSQICGQCHSYFSFSDPEFWKTGFKFRAGQDLHDTRYVHSFHDPYVQSRPDLLMGYWNDGTMRLAGREFSALDDSACYTNGNISCLSCHSLHHSDPDDLLIEHKQQDDACLQCHQTLGKDIAAHTHHPVSSSGSRCYNCHMPFTSFGLLRAIRSHRIDSPTVEMTAKHGRPNACNLCHLDQALSWTAGYLKEWYDQPVPSLTKEQQQISSSLLLLTKGDAVQRAVIAWAFRQSEARQSSDNQLSWAPRFLVELLRDPYTGVRIVAEESLRSFEPFREINYDVFGTEEQQRAGIQEIIKIWEQKSKTAVTNPSRKLLLEPDGTVDRSSLKRLQRQRDDRPILLPE